VIEYIYKALTVWFIGFFPLFELFIAVPAGFSLKLDPVSIVIFCVAGNFFPVVLIDLGYNRLVRYENVKAWLDRRVSERMIRNVNRYGTWYLLIITPWFGVWGTAVTARILRLERKQMVWGVLASLTFHAIILVVMIHAGIGFFSSS
jgi:uncharacterized membrane protein